MNLFTFNSKLKLITFFSLCVFMLGLVHSALIVAAKNIPLASQSQNQENQIKLEDYVHGNQSCSNVLVGSSLMSLILPEYFSEKNVCNIAFGGHSAFDGLRLIQLAQRKEIKNIYVEMTVLRNQQDQFIQDSTSGVQFALAHYFPIFLSRHQPMTMLLSLLRYFFPPGTKHITPEQFETMILVHLAEHQNANADSQNDWQKKLNDLSVILHELKALGVQIHLVHMPVDSRVAATAGMKQRVELNLNVFPLHDWSWINDLPPDLTTTDGIHMTEASAKKFALLLEQKMSH